METRSIDSEAAQFVFSPRAFTFDGSEFLERLEDVSFSISMFGSHGELSSTVESCRVGSSRNVDAGQGGARKGKLDAQKGRAREVRRDERRQRESRVLRGEAWNGAGYGAEWARARAWVRVQVRIRVWVQAEAFAANRARAPSRYALPTGATTPLTFVRSVLRLGPAGTTEPLDPPSPTTELRLEGRRTRYAAYRGKPPNDRRPTTE